MTRPEWVEAGVRAVMEATRDRAVSHREMIRAVIAAVEPLIRADERAKVAAEIEAVCQSHQNCPNPECAQAYRDAARIARGSGA